MLQGSGKNIAVIKIDIASKGIVGGLGVGAIIGIAVGALAVIGITIFLIFFYKYFFLRLFFLLRVTPTKLGLSVAERGNCGCTVFLFHKHSYLSHYL